MLTNVGKAAIQLTICSYCKAPAGEACFSVSNARGENELEHRPHGVHYGSRTQQNGPTVRGMLVKDVENSLQYKMLVATTSTK